MNATIAKDKVAVTHEYHKGHGIDCLLVSAPNGWDDVKEMQSQVLQFNGGHYTFTGWNSDRNEAYFKRGGQFATITR